MTRNEDRKGMSTNFYILYTFQNNNGDTQDLNYEVPFDTLINGIRHYFKDNDVELDGRDKDIYNLMVSLECIESILNEDSVINYYKKVCEEDAKSFFKEENLKEYKEKLEYVLDSVLYDYEYDEEIIRNSNLNILYSKLKKYSEAENVAYSDVKELFDSKYNI